MYGNFKVEFKVNVTSGVIDTELSESLCEADFQVRPYTLIKNGVIYSALNTYYRGFEETRMPHCANTVTSFGKKTWKTEA